MKIKHLFIAFVLFAAILFAGCGSKDTSDPVVPEGAQAGDLVGLKSCSYKAGEIEYSADCSTLVVPENRSTPNSRLIALPVIRVHALNGGDAEPIFFLVGTALGVPEVMQNILLDPPWIMKIALGMGVLAAVLTIPALVYTVLAWKYSYWCIAGRAYYNLVTIAAVAFVWFLNYWNLLGWRY